MAKKVTGIFLLGVMALLITLKHPALNYCLCLDALNLSSDCCEEEVVTSDCGSCEHGGEESSCQASQEEHDDCLVSLAFDTGEFVQTGKFKFSDLAMVVEQLPLEILLIDSYEVETLSPSRGSPDPPPLQSAPAYQRYSTYLL